jgi:hypothetical protein
MAETTTAPNNKAVAFKAKPVREMASAGKSKAVHRKASRAIKRGLISEKAARRHLSGA